MDIYANRRKWLQHWIDTEYGGNRARAAEATGYSRSQISQFLSATYQDGRSPQENASRTIEKRFGKPERVMENPAPGVEAIESAQSGKPEPLPLFVQSAIDAVFAAYHSGVKTEVFASVTTLLNAQITASIKPPERDETAGKSKSGARVPKGVADAAVATAERSLANRSGGTGGRKTAGERGPAKRRSH